MAEFILADNQELTRLALEHIIIRGEKDHNLFYAPDKTELVETLKQYPKGIVLIDYTLFDFTDADNMLIVHDRFPQSHWILISEDLTETFLHKIIYATQNVSIVFKDLPVNVIRDAIMYAENGSRYICQRATEILLTQHNDEAEPTNLTQTEIEIIKAIAKGRTTKEIAAERYSSIHTINTHRKNIFRKLNVNTAHEAVKYAFRAGLVDPSEFYI